MFTNADRGESKLRSRPARQISRRGILQCGSTLLGLSLPQFLQLNSLAGESDSNFGRAKSCILLYCWGGMSHHDTWDPKPQAPAEVRGEFECIDTATPGIQVGEHIPLLAERTERLAIVRSIHHSCTAHGKGMYWNLTGHPPPQPAAAVNLPPSRNDWPSLPAMISALRSPGPGMPGAIRLPYPLVDNGTLQAGEWAGWLGVNHDPIVVRTPQGKPYGGVSRDLGSPVLNLSKGIDRGRLQARRQLHSTLESSVGNAQPQRSYAHFHELAMDLLVRRQVRDAFDLSQEPAEVHAAYGDHLCGQSLLLARRLAEAGLPIIQVICAAGDLNGGSGDHWDTHGDNFNRLKKNLLPPFDRAASALLDDLDQRGKLDETLVVMLGDFGRTPKINKGAGRDHYPFAYSVVLAGGGIRGGQVYGSSDRLGAFPHTQACGPRDLHATIFQAMGINLQTRLYDNLNRPHPITDGRPLPLFA